MNQEDLSFLATVILYKMQKEERDVPSDKFVEIKSVGEGGEWRWVNLNSDWSKEKVEFEGTQDLKGFKEKMQSALSHSLDEWVIKKWSSVWKSDNWSTSWYSDDKNVVMIGKDSGEKKNILFKFDFEDKVTNSKEYLVGIYEHKLQEDKGVLTLGLESCNDSKSPQCQISKKEKLSNEKIKIIFRGS